MDPKLIMNVSVHIFSEYDFIGVAERMDETAVALQLLLGLDTQHILHLDSDNGGGNLGGATSSCRFDVPMMLSPTMMDFFYNRTGPWQRSTSVRIESALHRAASSSLDMTIDNLGRARFHKALERFRLAQQRVKERCSSVSMPVCSETENGDGKRQSKESAKCLYERVGCGMSCLDRVADELDLG